MERDGAIDLVDWSDTGWVGAGDEDDLDERLMAEDEPVDERQPHVMTALGPIEPSALGLTLIGAWGVPLVGSDRDPATALLQLEQLYATGVRAVVELAPVDSESHCADLAWLMARSPIHIVTSVGLESGQSVSDATSSVPVRAGLRIGSSAPAGRPRDDASRLPIFLDLATRCAAQGASYAAEPDTGVPLTVVANPLATSISDCEAALLSGDRLVLTASDDASTLPAIAASFKRLADSGFGDKLALGYAGDPITVMERLPIFLMEAGFSSIEVRQILLDNPLKSLVVPGGAQDDGS